jgi:alkylation response protein AidB-like acyl-CoA dehydrogenase
MNDSRTQDSSLAPFRSDVRKWLAENFPPSLAHQDSIALRSDPKVTATEPDFPLWRARMADKGWGAPTWPVDLGGGGLSTQEAEVLTEEMVRIGAFNPMRGNGLVMLGPTLLEFGTDEQKTEHIPRIARGEARWCQGFSEPGAGSDLASLRMKCLDEGSHWLVSGQKIWTSFAHNADWCFALVRTDGTKKHGGISFLLIDMRSPGIRVRPLTLISGETHFCEVFFDDVRVPKRNLVGAVNEGWKIATRLMQHERSGLSEGRGEGADLLQLARTYVGVDTDGRIADRDLRSRLIRHALRAHAYTRTLQRKASVAHALRAPISDISSLKNLGSTVAQERASLAVEVLGCAAGLGWEGEGYTDRELELTRAWLHSRAFSIYGGTFEIQNNITSKKVLGLPSG